VLPAHGYCEWQATPDGKQPYFLHLDNTVLNIPCLFELWRDHDKDSTVPPSPRSGASPGDGRIGGVESNDASSPPSIVTWVPLIPDAESDSR
jgi:hypothetical protein